MKMHKGFIALGLLFASGFVDAAATKPNVIFIKMDNQRFDSLSMTGHSVTNIPNINRQTKEGAFWECLYHYPDLRVESR